MSPYEIEILLHYYACLDDHPQMYSPPPIWRDTINWFLQNQLLQDNGKADDAAYKITERGNVLIRAMCALPLPVWTMPKDNEK